jgi:hypothetical protein
MSLGQLFEPQLILTKCLSAKPFLYVNGDVPDLTGRIAEICCTSGCCSPLLTSKTISANNVVRIDKAPSFGKNNVVSLAAFRAQKAA